MAKGYTDVDELLNSLNPDTQVKDKTQKADLDKAKRVRETFLGYRTQLVESLKILNKHAKEDDKQAAKLEGEVTGLLAVLDKLDKRKKVTADTLLDFMSQMRQVGSNLNGMADDKNNKTGLAAALRERRKEIVEDDKKQEKRFAKLASNIGQSVDTFVRDKADMVGAGGGSALKLAMASWLGPAAPLVQLVDELVDIDGKVAGLYKRSLTLAEKTAKGVLGLPGKMVKAGGSWSKSVLDYFKQRDYVDDAQTGRKDKSKTKMMRDQLGALRDMRSRLHKMATAAGQMVGKLLMGLAGVVGRMVGTLGSLLTGGFRTLLAVLPGKALMARLAALLAGGAASVFKRFMPGPEAGRAGGRFSRSAMGKGLALGGKALGAAGGMYGMYSGYNTIRDNKDKGFFEGGLDSRAGGYGSAMMGGAATGAMIGSIIPGVGTVVGAVVGGAIGGLTALIADNQEAVLATVDNVWAKSKEVGANMLESAKGFIGNWGPTLAAGPLGLLFKGTEFALDRLSDELPGLGASMKEAVSGFIGDVKSWFSGLDMKKSVKEGVEAATDAYARGKGAVKGWIDEAGRKATTFALNAATSAKDYIHNGTGWNPASVLPAGIRAQVQQTKVNANYADVAGDIQAASKESGVGVGTLARFAQIESGFNPNAQAGTSSAGGMYQFIDSTWAETLQKHGSKYGLGANTSKFDPKASALMGAEFLKDNQKHLQRNVGGTIGDTELYLAHFLGAGGATQFLHALRANPNATAASVFPKQAASNQSIFFHKDGRPKTMAEVYQWADNKIRETDSIAQRAESDAGVVGGSMLSQPTPGSFTGQFTAQGGAVGHVRAADQVSNVAPRIPGVTPMPAANDTGTQAGQQPVAPVIASQAPKSNLDSIPFVPDDQSLLAFNLVGAIG